MKLNINVDLFGAKYIGDLGKELPEGKILWDFHLPDGQRIHILDSHIDNMFVWQNAMVFGINHLDFN